MQSDENVSDTCASRVAHGTSVTPAVQPLAVATSPVCATLFTFASVTICSCAARQPAAVWWNACRFYVRKGSAAGTVKYVPRQPNMDTLRASNMRVSTAARGTGAYASMQRAEAT